MTCAILLRCEGQGGEWFGVDVVINRGESGSAPILTSTHHDRATRAVLLGRGRGGGGTREAGDWSETLVLLLYSCRIISGKRGGCGGGGGGG